MKGQISLLDGGKRFKVVVDVLEAIFKEME